MATLKEKLDILQGDFQAIVERTNNIVTSKELTDLEVKEQVGIELNNLQTIVHRFAHDVNTEYKKRITNG